MGYLWIGKLLWPGGVIPVDLDSLGTDAEFNANMRSALLDWMHKTELVFVPHSAEGDFLTFQYVSDQNGSNAGGTGHIGGPQVMKLGSKDDWSHFAHEVGHTIGFIHEHQRPDRGGFVEPIPPAPLPENLKIYAHEPGKNEVYGPYDWESVNHYKLDSDLRVLPPHFPQRIGSDSGASEGDVMSVRAAYGFTPSAGMLHPQSAITRGPGSLDVFARWQNNKIYRASWPGAWQSWTLVDGQPKSTEAQFANVGRGLSAPTAVSRTPDTIDVFLRGLYDDIYTATWANGDWTPWTSLGGGKGLSPVVAVSRTPDTIDAAVRGLNGGVYTARLDGTTGWSSWERIGVGVCASDVTLVAPTSDRMHVFVHGLNGGVYTARWRPGQEWSTWDRVADGVAMFGTSIAAVSRRPDTVDIFIVGGNRGVYTSATHDGGLTWKPWFRLSDGVVAPGTTVTAVTRPDDVLDVFVVGEDRRIWTTSWDGSGATTWDDGWKPLGDHRVAPRSAISATSRDRYRIDLFAVGDDGRTWTAGITDRQLAGWWPVTPDGN